MERERRSKSSHLFQKDSFMKKTQRNATVSSRSKLLPNINIVKNKSNSSHSQLKQIPSPPPEISTKIKPAVIRDLRKDMLYIPPKLLKEPPNLNLMNSSFISFNELHKKDPLLYPDLNYVSFKEKQMVEEKKKKDETMSAIDRFFKEMKRDSQLPRASVMILKSAMEFREMNQVVKELSHNDTQKKLYESEMEKFIFSSNRELYEKYKKSTVRFSL